MPLPVRVTTKTGLILNSTTPSDLAAYDKHHYTVYVLLGVAAMVLYMTKNMFLIYLTNRSGRRLHNKALYSILRAPMRFFDTHPIGRTRGLTTRYGNVLVPYNIFCKLIF